MNITDNFHKRERLYQSVKGVSSRIEDILPDKVTLSRYPEHSFQAIQYARQTPFMEIKMVKPQDAWSDASKELVKKDIRQFKIREEEFSQRMLYFLKQGIKEAWSPDKLHVMLHSSGHDSRLISIAIKQLYEELGPEWLGDIIFFEMGFETKEFRRIIEIEGWSKDQCIIYHEGRYPSEVHAESFEFKNAWKRLNCGTIGYPVNTNYDCIEWLKEKLGRTDLQVITGHAGSEIAKGVISGKSVEAWLELMYYFAFTGFPCEADRLHPYFYLPFIEALYRYGKEHVNNRSFTDVVLKHVAPELEGVKRVRHRELVKQQYMAVSERIFRNSINDYASSWYGRNIAPNVARIKALDYSIWWGSWNLASACEYMRGKGIHVATP